MTPAERYRDLREMTEHFKRGNMIKHHFIRHINEAVDEALEKLAKVMDLPDNRQTRFEIAKMIRAMKSGAGKP